MTEGNGAPAPVATVPPAVAPPPPVAAPVAAPPAQGEPDWLPDRLKRAEETARQKVFADLGVTDPAKAKELLAAAAKAEADARSVGEKLGAATTQLQTVQTELERQKAITTEHASRMMMALTAEQQSAVKAIAGEDAATQLRTITALTPTWAAAGTPAGGAPPPPKAPVTPPTGTAPPVGGAPPPAPPGSPPDHAAIHAELLKTNPFAAARYGLEHADEVFKTPS